MCLDECQWVHMLYLCRYMRTCRVLRSSNRISVIHRSSFIREKNLWNFALTITTLCKREGEFLLIPSPSDRADPAIQVHMKSVCVNPYGYTNCLWTYVCMPATVHIALRISSRRGNYYVLIHTLGYCDMRAQLLCSDHLRLVHVSDHVRSL